MGPGAGGVGETESTEGRVFTEGNEGNEDAGIAEPGYSETLVNFVAFC